MTGNPKEVGHEGGRIRERRKVVSCRETSQAGLSAGSHIMKMSAGKKGTE